MSSANLGASGLIDRLEDAVEYCKRRGYESYELFGLGIMHRLPEKFVSLSSPRECSVVKLGLEEHQEDRLLPAGIKTLGGVADMTLDVFRRLGFTPAHHHEITASLAGHGFRMSFGLFPRERFQWSPKRANIAGARTAS